MKAYMCRNFGCTFKKKCIHSVPHEKEILCAEGYCDHAIPAHYAFCVEHKEKFEIPKEVFEI